MKKLLALLAAVGAVVFFWRKKHQGDDTSTWDTASDTASSWGDTAQDKAEDVADKAEDVADTASDNAAGRRETPSSDAADDAIVVSLGRLRAQAL